MSEMFTKCNGFIVSGDPLVYADSATMTGQGTVSEPFGVKSTDLFVQEPLYTGTSGNSAYIGFDSNNAGIAGPVLNTKTFAGYWNGSAVYQKLVTGEFTTNVTSDVYNVDADYSASQRKWIDPSQSFIHYGSSANVLPSTWVLGATNRLGGLSLLSNVIRARSNDTTNTQCTAFVVVKWVETN